MLYFTATVHTLGVKLRDRVRATVAEPERGNAIEYVLLAVAAVAFAGIVIAAIRHYLKTQAGNL